MHDWRTATTAASHLRQLPHCQITPILSSVLSSLRGCGSGTINNAVLSYTSQTTPQGTLKSITTMKLVSTIIWIGTAGRETEM